MLDPKSLQRTFLPNLRRAFAQSSGREALRLVVVWVAFFTTTASGLLLWSVVQSTFIKQYGPDYFPYLYFYSSASALAGAFLYSLISNRLKKITIASSYNICALVLTLISWYLLKNANGSSDPSLYMKLYFTIAIVANTTFVILLSAQIWALLGDIFTGGQSKRIFPILSTAVTVGSVFGGLWMRFLAPRLGTENLLLVAAACMAITVPVLFATSRAYKKELAWKNIAAKSKDRNYTFKELFAYANQSKFFISLASIILMSFMLTRLFHFALAESVDAAYPTLDGYTSFMGLYVVIHSLISVIFEGFFLSKLYERVGLTRSMMITSDIVLLLTLGMFAMPIFMVVVATSLVREIVLSIQQNAINIMNNIVPDRFRSALDSFLNGYMPSFGTVLGSLLMLGINYFTDVNATIGLTVRVVSFAILLLLLIRSVVNYRLRREFFRLLEASLQNGDFKTKLRSIETLVEHKYLRRTGIDHLIDSLEDEAESLTVKKSILKVLGNIADPSTMRTVVKHLEHPSSDIRLAAAQALGGYRKIADQFFTASLTRFNAIRILRKMFRDDSHPKIRVAALDALIALQDEQAISTILEVLHRRDPHQIKECLYALRKFQDPSIIDELKPFLDDKDPALKNLAWVALWQFSWKQDYVTEQVGAGLKLMTAFGKANKATRERLRYAIKTVGDLKLEIFTREVKEFLNAPDEEIAFESAMTLAKLGQVDCRDIFIQAFKDNETAHIRRVRGLRDQYDPHPSISDMVEELCDQFVLQYPANLPVDESLDTVISSIPQSCIDKLLEVYRKAGDFKQANNLDSAKEWNVKARPFKTPINLVGEPERMGLYLIRLLTLGYSPKTLRHLPSNATSSGFWIVDAGEFKDRKNSALLSALSDRLVVIYDNSTDDSEYLRLNKILPLRRIIFRKRLAADDLAKAVLAYENQTEERPVIIKTPSRNPALA